MRLVLAMLFACSSLGCSVGALGESRPCLPPDFSSERGFVETKVFPSTQAVFFATKGIIEGTRDNEEVSARFVIALRAETPFTSAQTPTTQPSASFDIPVPAEEIQAPTTDRVDTTTGIVNVPRNVLVHISGIRGMAQNEQVTTSAESTTFAIIPHRTIRTKGYVVHYNHCPKEVVNVTALKGGDKGQLCDNGVIEITYDDVTEVATFGPFVPEASCTGELNYALETARKIGRFTWSH